MPNKTYDNFFLANEIEDQYKSHLDLAQFCTIDNSLTGTAGPDLFSQRHSLAATTVGDYTLFGGGVINGSVALVYDDYVEAMKKAGCDLSGCTTDEEVLAAIEAFEDNPPAPAKDTGISDQTRIADALEDIVALSMPDVNE